MNFLPKSWPVALLLSVLTLALLTRSVVDRITSWPGQTLDLFTHQTSANARKIRNAFVDLFQLQPRITVNNSVAFDQSKTALELAVASRETEVIRNTSQTWLGSTKTIRIKIRYRVKAGFDLTEKLQVDVTDQGAIVKVPKAKILSIEPLSTSVEELKDGLWNKIQPQELENELKAMPELVREKESSLPTRAEQNFTRLLSERLADLPIHVEVQGDERLRN